MKVIFFLFFIVFCSCISVKDKDTLQVQSVLEREKAKIIENEKFYIYDSRNFSLELPYSWRSYQEPQVKETIRHSPFNKKESSIETETYLVCAIVHTKKNVRNAIRNQIRKSEYYIKSVGRYQNISDIKKEKGIDSIGNFIKKTFFFSQKKKRYKNESYYYILEKKYLFCRISYPVGLTNHKEDEVYKILKTIKVK